MRSVTSWLAIALLASVFVPFIAILALTMINIVFDVIKEKLKKMPS